MSIKFNSDGEDVSQEEEDVAAPAPAADAAPAPVSVTLVRKHDKAVSERLLHGEQLYGRAKYIEKYRLGVWHKEEKAKIDAKMDQVKDHEFRDILEKGLTVEYKELAAQRTKYSNEHARLETAIEKWEKDLIRDEESGDIVLSNPAFEEPEMQEGEGHKHHKKHLFGLAMTPGLEEFAPVAEGVALGTSALSGAGHRRKKPRYALKAKKKLDELLNYLKRGNGIGTASTLTNSYTCAISLVPGC